ncbi:MAG: hypothetical protein GY765_30070 [bacterium]|nr:hypothetical protein [bacterium]
MNQHGELLIKNHKPIMVKALRGGYGLGGAVTPWNGTFFAYYISRES